MKLAILYRSLSYAPLKRPDRLKPSEVRRPVALRRENRALDRAYELKEYLATILRQGKPEDAEELLAPWLEWAARSRLTPSVKLARTVRKHAAGILAYLDTRMTNGPVEGINNECTSSPAAPTASFLRSALLDAVPLLWRHRTGADSTHTS